MGKKTATVKSVYEELGFPHFKEMETKADLTIEIGKEIKKKKLTQTRAAKILGLTQPKLSELLRGHFKGYSVERLIHFLTELGKDVDIVIRPKKTRNARVQVYHSGKGEGSRSVPLAAKGRL